MRLLCLRLSSPQQPSAAATAPRRRSDAALSMTGASGLEDACFFGLQRTDVRVPCGVIRVFIRVYIW